MKKLILRLYKRFQVRLRRLNRSKALKTYEEVELHEKTAFKICLKLINHEDSSFMIAPLSNKRYISNDELSLFIIIDYGRVEITNHVFHYDVRLSNRDFDRLLYLFNEEVEKRRSTTENEIKTNIKNTLDKIYEKIILQTKKNKKS